MQDTPAPSFVAALNAQERASLFTDAHVRTLPAAFASLPDPRKQRGQRDDLPFLLTCLAAALLCDCNSLEAVGRWTRDQQAVLARVCGPRRHLTPTGSLYRRLLPRLSVAHVERALASWVPQTRPLRDRDPPRLRWQDGARRAHGGASRSPSPLSLHPHHARDAGPGARGRHDQRDPRGPRPPAPAAPARPGRHRRRLADPNRPGSACPGPGRPRPAHGQGQPAALARRTGGLFYRSAGHQPHRPHRGSPPGPHRDAHAPRQHPAERLSADLCPLPPSPASPRWPASSAPSAPPAPSAPRRKRPPRPSI